MTPNTNDLLIFLTLTETRSMTIAAQQTGLTKSAISQALKRVEDTLGAKLLFRTTRSMSLTETGSKLIPACQTLRQAQQELQQTLTAAQIRQGETLTITAPHALCHSVLVPILSDLAKTQGIKPRLIAEDSPVNLVEHQIDLAIRVGASAPQSAHISRIGTLRESIYGAPHYLERMGNPPITLLDLQNWAHIANDWQGNPIRYRSSSGETLQVLPAARSNTILGVKAFVEDGFGIALLPDLIAQGSKTLVQLLPISETPIYALHQHGKTPPKNVKALISRLRNALR
ncbi:LysR family transcriptional regulator [Roseovarius sp. EL26]|uniref:LysR family transcriptional regulator n=1 Tax=Roseovarius sp. EL26 TaxID=2126672 RepID=UPI000EA153BF|nr:LysR family transcriptional regulator [Roseovarius sp. EL26]